MALTITRPFIGTLPNTEHLWMELSGTSIALIGPYLRRQTPGMAYEHPPDNLAPTANVDYSEDRQVKFLLVATDGRSKALLDRGRTDDSPAGNPGPPRGMPASPRAPKIILSRCSV